MAKKRISPKKEFLAVDAIREQVRSLVCLGIRRDDIETIIGCNGNTLSKYFRDELDLGMADAHAAICGHIFAAANAGD